MDDLWVNIKFGKRHLQIDRHTFAVVINPYYDKSKGKWFKVYEFFWYEAQARQE